MKKLLVFVSVVLMLTLTGCGTEENTASEANDPGSYKITDTGQTTSYNDDGDEISPEEGDAYYGQDGNYTGTAESFTDNGDTTITDNVTGLMWQQVPSDDHMSYEEAQAYCEDLDLGGYDDWRLPTVKELFGLQNFSTGWPYIDDTYFDFPADTVASSGPTGGSSDGGPQGTTDDSTDDSMLEAPSDESEVTIEENTGASVSKSQGQFWTDQEYEVGDGTIGTGQAVAFGVNEATGHIKAYPSEVTGDMGKCVRAVRGDTMTINDFVDNEDGTITDNATGLMWTQDDNGEGILWNDALNYAENLDTAGYDDWRLPNVKELQSIVNYDGTYPAIYDDYFNITPLDNNENYYFWTSTSAYFSPAAPDYKYAWYVAFGYAVGEDGEDVHGAGAVRFSPKTADESIDTEGGDNYYNSVYCVRDAD